MSLARAPMWRPSRRLASRIGVLVAIATFACLSSFPLYVTLWVSPPARILHQHNNNKIHHHGGGRGEVDDGAAHVAHHKSSTKGDDKNLWDASTTLPPWMKRYFEWHRTERARLTRENWKSRRYLVVRCLKDDLYCGGASDRLKPLPYLLMLASRTNRLLFITWSRPAPLEEFFVPPKGGLDWTVPEAVDFDPHLRARGDIRRNNHTGIIASEKTSFWVDTDMFLVEARLATSLSDEAYNAGRPSPQVEEQFDRVYGEVWRVLFEPTPPLAARIAATQSRLQLTPGGYVSVHVRAQYVRNFTGHMKPIANALHCAASLVPSAPIYIASDSAAAARFALEYARNFLNQTVVANLHETEPLHLDRGKDFLTHPHADWDQYPPSAYYDTFVDLLLLGGGRCSAYGIGGYGHWASLLTRDPRCAVRHTERICIPPPLRRFTDRRRDGTTALARWTRAPSPRRSESVRNSGTHDG